MTRSEFVSALKAQTSDAALFGTKANLTRPPGRKPRPQDIKLSKWYESLPDLDRANVDEVMQEAAELATFSFLCVLDGVSAIEDGPEKGELRLHYLKAGNDLLLNDPSEELLHDSYNALCQGVTPIAPQRSEMSLYEVGSTLQLREHQTSTDAIDLHTVAAVERRSNQAEAPAIALPKNEHRKL